MWIDTVHKKLASWYVICKQSPSNSLASFLCAFIASTLNGVYSTVNKNVARTNKTIFSGNNNVHQHTSIKKKLRERKFSCENRLILASSHLFRYLPIIFVASIQKEAPLYDTYTSIKIALERKKKFCHNTVIRRYICCIASIMENVCFDKKIRYSWHSHHILH